jgi:hypothetical protein
MYVSGCLLSIIRASVRPSVHTSIYFYNYHQYPSSSLLFKSRRFGDWILSPKRRVLIKAERWIMYKTLTIMLIYHRHKPIDLICPLSLSLSLSLSIYIYIYIPYILESNLHPFYSFRGLKMQMRIRFGILSRSLAK